MSRCFISHASADRLFVDRQLIGLLKALGIDVWYAEEDIRTSQQWERSIKAGLADCDWFVLVMSPNSAQSEWVKDELHWILDNKAERLIPILIEQCNLQDFHIRLPRIQYVDFSTDSQAARNKLITLFIDGEFRPMRRATGIIGQWNGMVHQHEGPNGEPLEYAAKLTLRVEKQTINGFFSITNPLDGPPTVGFALTGGFFHDRFLQMNYISDNPAVIQFGSIILHLDDNADVMNGKFVGYGARSRKIITGHLRLSKTAQQAAEADR